MEGRGRYRISTRNGIDSSIFAIAETYDIGPGREFSQLSDFDWDSLKPGDIVNIQSKDLP